MSYETIVFYFIGMRLGVFNGFHVVSGDCGKMAVTSIAMSRV